VSPVKYELGFNITEDGILHSHCRDYLKSYIALTGWTQQWRRNVSPVKYELGFYIPEDDILHSRIYVTLRVCNLVPACLCVTQLPVSFSLFPGQHALPKSSRLQHISVSDPHHNGNVYFYLSNK
jgi:hypothetical protein